MSSMRQKIDPLCNDLSGNEYDKCFRYHSAVLRGVNMEGVTGGKRTSKKSQKSRKSHKKQRKSRRNQRNKSRKH